MRIALVDQPAWVGGQLYVENLARALLTLPLGERPNIVWIGPERDLHPTLATTTRVSAPESGRASYAAFVAREARREHCDFVYPYMLRIPGIKSAYWLPDLQHTRLPHLFTRKNRVQRDIAYRFFSLVSPSVVLSSRAVESDFVEFFPWVQNKIRILPFHTPLDPGDVDESSEEAKSVLSALPNKYVYVANQMWQHKDHPTVIKGLSELRRQTGLVAPLVLSGSRTDYRNPNWSAHVDRMIDDHGLRNVTTYLGHLPRSIQLAVMRRASVVVQPSLFEGWSTVVEDARALGCSLLMSDIAPNREQAPKLGQYFSAGNERDLAEKLQSLWNDDSERPSYDQLYLEATRRVLTEARTFMGIARGD